MSTQLIQFLAQKAQRRASQVLFWRRQAETRGLPYHIRQRYWKWALDEEERVKAEAEQVEALLNRMEQHYAYMNRIPGGSFDEFD